MKLVRTMALTSALVLGACGTQVMKEMLEMPDANAQENEDAGDEGNGDNGPKLETYTLRCDQVVGVEGDQTAYGRVQFHDWTPGMPLSFSAMECHENYDEGQAEYAAGCQPTSRVAFRADGWIVVRCGTPSAEHENVAFHVTVVR